MKRKNPDRHESVILLPMRRASLVVVASVAVAAVVATGFQGPPPPQAPPGVRNGDPQETTQGTGLLLGTVVDAITGRPVPGATVMLGGGAGNQLPLVVGDDGQFVFRDLPAGTYALVASKNGYLEGSQGRTSATAPARPVALRSDERKGDLVIRLWRQAIVSGNVVDGRGEPAADLKVTLYQRTVVNGSLGLQESQTTRSDDRGAYRFFRVKPGRYLIGARQDPEELMNSAMTAMVADLPAIMGLLASAMSGGPQLPEVDFRARLMPTVFAPGVATVDEAAPFDVAPGDERSGITIRAARVPTYRISGTVSGPDVLPGNLVVQLTSPALNDLAVGVNLGQTGRGGRFDYLALPPGRYMLRAIAVPRPAQGRGGGTRVDQPAPAESTWWATMPITIGDRDETGIALVLREGVRISGRLEFEGTSEPAAPDMFSVIATRADMVPGPRTDAPSRAAADGSFRTAGLPAGRYFLRLAMSKPPWRLKAVRVGGRDVTDVPIEIDADPLADVVIAMTDRRMASLAGAVTGEQVGTEGSSAVFVFPTDRRLWAYVGPGAQRFKTAETADGGRYVMRDLPEGEYFVIAASEERLRDWLQPDVLEVFAALATRLQLGEGEHTLDLRRSNR
jgi:protocatechuate 3,4-dioxygenase beta subunit